MSLTPLGAWDTIRFQATAWVLKPAAMAGSFWGGISMITLNMRLTAKPGREAELTSAIRDKWMKAMSRQPGFIRGVMLKPYEGELAAKVGLTEQDFTFEVVSFWESEEQRAAWAASDIHAEVIAYVSDAILPETGKKAVMFTIEEHWEA